jgi:ubiquinone/menaquinone biosynthesis C-methylase UbiE
VIDMPVQPNFLERLLFYQLNMAPAPLLDLAGALSYQTLATAAQLDLFRALHQKPMTVPALADRLAADERGVQALLEALAAIGYVEKKDGCYANSAATDKWLVGESFFDLATVVHYWSAALSELWPGAADVIRTGQRLFHFYDWVEARPALSASFQRMMVTSAELAGGDIADKLDLPASAARLLDVGGGHGMFSIILCQRHPELRATILDSPSALVTARELVTEHQLSGRIDFLEGDLWHVNWGQGYDGVLLFNLLHHFDLEANRRLLSLAAGALRPAGRVAILEQLAGKGGGSASNAMVSLIALQYYLFADGRVYTTGEIDRLLGESGFAAPRYHALSRIPGTTLAVALKETPTRGAAAHGRAGRQP